MAKQGLGAEPDHAGGLGDELGRGQHPTARQAQQIGRQPSDPPPQVFAELVDPRGERLDRGDQLLADADLDR
jgi:hypothetical protein